MPRAAGLRVGAVARRSHRLVPISQWGSSSFPVCPRPPSSAGWNLCFRVVVDVFSLSLHGHPSWLLHIANQTNHTLAEDVLVANFTHSRALWLKARAIRQLFPFESVQISRTLDQNTNVSTSLDDESPARFAALPLRSLSALAHVAPCAAGAMPGRSVLHWLSDVETNPHLQARWRPCSTRWSRGCSSFRGRTRKQGAVLSP